MDRGILGIALNYREFAALSALLVARYQLEPKDTKGKCSKTWRGVNQV